MIISSFIKSIIQSVEIENFEGKNLKITRIHTIYLKGSNLDIVIANNSIVIGIVSAPSTIGGDQMRIVRSQKFVGVGSGEGTIHIFENVSTLSIPKYLSGHVSEA